MSRYYDMQGQPIKMMEWARLFENTEARRIAYTAVPNGVVSTTWLGVDYNFDGNGRPLIFISTAFVPDEKDSERYATLEEARAGHEAMVAKWSARTG